MTCIN